MLIVPLEECVVHEEMNQIGSQRGFGTQQLRLIKKAYKMRNMAVVCMCCVYCYIQYLSQFTCM